jgi:hypothetical protein
MSDIAISQQLFGGDLKYGHTNKPGDGKKHCQEISVSCGTVQPYESA